MKNYKIINITKPKPQIDNKIIQSKLNIINKHPNNPNRYSNTIISIQSSHNDTMIQNKTKQKKNKRKRSKNTINYNFKYKSHSLHTSHYNQN